jgi:hypothetical protein
MPKLLLLEWNSIPVIQTGRKFIFFSWMEYIIYTLRWPMHGNGVIKISMSFCAAFQVQLVITATSIFVATIGW